MNSQLWFPALGLVGFALSTITPLLCLSLSFSLICLVIRFALWQFHTIRSTEHSYRCPHSSLSYSACSSFLEIFPTFMSIPLFYESLSFPGPLIWPWVWNYLFELQQTMIPSVPESISSQWFSHKMWGSVCLSPFHDWLLTKSVLCWLQEGNYGSTLMVGAVVLVLEDSIPQLLP